MTVLFKVGALETSFWVASFWQYIGLSILGIILFIFVKPYRKALFILFKNKGISFYGINLINEFLFIAGTLLANFAALIGPVALVSLIGSSQPIFVLAFGSIAALMLPKYFTSELDVPKKDII